MAFTKRSSDNDIQLTGFWTRGQGEILCGVLRKFVPNDKDPKKVRPFYIIQVLQNKDTGPVTATIREDETSHIAVNGEYVGVAANYALASVIDHEEDIGKTLRLTINGERTNPKGGKSMILIDVEIDDDSK